MSFSTYQYYLQKAQNFYKAFHIPLQHLYKNRSTFSPQLVTHILTDTLSSPFVLSYNYDWRAVCVSHHSSNPRSSNPLQSCPKKGSGGCSHCIWWLLSAFSFDFIFNVKYIFSSFTFYLKKIKMVNQQYESPICKPLYAWCPLQAYVTIQSVSYIYTLYINIFGVLTNLMHGDRLLVEIFTYHIKK